MEAKGKKFLKITGILMIIFGALGALGSLIGILGGSVLLVNSAGNSAAGVLSGLAVVISIFGLVFAVLELVSGIIGMKNCDKPEKAGTCFKLGIALIVLSLISSIGGMAAANGFTFSSIISLVIGLVLPVLFCYGAKLNKPQ